MAYDRVSLSRKKELEKPDEFMESLRTLFKYILSYKFQISIGMGVLLSLIIVFAAVGYFSEVAEKKASVMLNQGMVKYSSLLSDKKPIEACDIVAGDFESILSKYPRTVAGKFAMIHLANIYYSADKYDKSIALYEKADGNFTENKLFANLIHMGLGRCFEAIEDNTKAVEYFKRVINDQDSLMKDEALFSLGRIYNKMGEKGKSMDAYKKIISDHESSIYMEVAMENIAG
jgi:tetratricopeptide (TPR) repeat protein